MKLLKAHIESTAIINILTMTNKWKETSKIEEGKLAIRPEVMLDFLRDHHDHEGANALYNRFKGWIKCDIGLHTLCEQVTRECDICTLAKTQIKPISERHRR